jgi:hypothetical protein
MSLNDPLDAFLQSHGEVESKISCTISSREADQMRHTLLWRHDPEASFSDWKIILETDDADTENCNEKTTAEDEKESDNPRNNEHANDGETNDDVEEQKKTNEEQDDDYYTDADSESDFSDLNTEDENPATTFHVHRNILASVSKYSQSQFSKHNQTSEQKTQTSIIKLHPVAIEAFPVFLDYLYSWPLGKLGFRRSNAVALRHLALYFGVDILLKDISELILLHFRCSRFMK